MTMTTALHYDNGSVMEFYRQVHRIRNHSPVDSTDKGLVFQPAPSPARRRCSFQDSSGHTSATSTSCTMEDDPAYATSSSKSSSPSTPPSSSPPSLQRPLAHHDRLEKAKRWLDSDAGPDHKLQAFKKQQPTKTSPSSLPSKSTNRIEEAKSLLERGRSQLREAQSEPVQLSVGALQDLHKALQVQELCLGKQHADCQATRLLLVESHAVRSHWGKAGLWMLRMLRASSFTCPLMAFVESSPSPKAHQALQVARSVLQEERLGDVAANQKMQYDRAAHWYEQALQRLSQIRTMDHTQTENDVVYIHGVAMGVHGVMKDDDDDILPVDSADLAIKLGQVYRMHKKYPRARRAYADACDGYLRVLGPTHPSTITARQQLAVVSEKCADAKPKDSKRCTRSLSGGSTVRTFKSTLTMFKRKRRKQRKDEDKSFNVDFDGDDDSLMLDDDDRHKGGKGGSSSRGSKLWKKMFGKRKSNSVVESFELEISIPLESQVVG